MRTLKEIFNHFKNESMIKKFRNSTKLSDTPHNNSIEYVCKECEGLRFEFKSFLLSTELINNSSDPKEYKDSILYLFKSLGRIVPDLYYVNAQNEFIIGEIIDSSDLKTQKRTFYSAIAEELFSYLDIIVKLDILDLRSNIRYLIDPESLSLFDSVYKENLHSIDPSIFKGKK